MICNNCKNLHKSTSVAVVGSNVLVTFNGTTNILNEDNFCFVLCQPIPAAGRGLAVKMTVNGQNIPLWDKYGNLVPGSGLVKGKIYKGYFGIGTEDHVISSALPCGHVKASYSYAVASPISTAETAKF